MTETKYISFSELREDMEIEGYKKGSTTTFASQKIVSIKKNKVFFNWGEPLENASDYVFSIELTEEELFIKYKDNIKEIKEALAHDLGQVDGYHEMWNSWLYYNVHNLANLASNLKEHKLRIIGYATLLTPKLSMFSDTALDIGIVAEYENGDRIWCHASDEYRKRLLKMKDYEYSQLKQEH